VSWLRLSSLSRYVTYESVESWWLRSVGVCVISIPPPPPLCILMSYPCICKQRNRKKFNRLLQNYNNPKFNCRWQTSDISSFFTSHPTIYKLKVRSLAVSILTDWLLGCVYIIQTRFPSLPLCFYACMVLELEQAKQYIYCMCSCLLLNTFFPCWCWWRLAVCLL